MNLDYAQTDILHEQYLLNWSKHSRTYMLLKVRASERSRIAIELGISKHTIGKAKEKQPSSSKRSEEYVKIQITLFFGPWCIFSISLSIGIVIKALKMGKILSHGKVIAYSCLTATACCLRLNLDLVLYSL